MEGWNRAAYPIAAGTGAVLWEVCWRRCGGVIDALLTRDIYRQKQLEGHGGKGMTRRCGRIGGIIVILMWLIGAAGCAKQTVPVRPGVGPAPQEGGAGAGKAAGLGPNQDKWKELGIYSEPQRREFLQKAKKFENADVHFLFDSYVLDANARSILDQKAQFLKQYPKVRVRIEGNCDDRGTTEYNLALGERRANSAYQYLINSGISASRMTTISYGEERPLVLGENEAAWAANRRDHFALKY